jgi:hypothetical protein
LNEARRLICIGTVFHSDSFGGVINANLTTSATFSGDIRFAWQYGVLSHDSRSFAPLLALHDMQHSAMFCGVAIRTSFTMCSQDAFDLRVPQELNSMLQ